MDTMTRVKELDDAYKKTQNRIRSLQCDLQSIEMEIVDELVRQKLHHVLRVDWRRLHNRL